MVPNDLAADITAAFAIKDARVLDPFCGSGRLLMPAAELGAYCVGVDVNPLAALILRAKSAWIGYDGTAKLLRSFDHFDFSAAADEYDLELGRQVEWFSARSRTELSQLIHWINFEERTKPEALVLSTILSATARDVSYCRMKQWKLHRMSRTERESYYRDAISTYRARLSDYVAETACLTKLLGRCTIIAGQSQELATLLEEHDECHPFDIVITSPPYGDSRTTVQYGGLSSLCIGVVRHVRGVEIEFCSAASIDSGCLGGSNASRDLVSEASAQPFCLKQYWNGPAASREADCLGRFSTDLAHCCAQAAKVLTPEGRFVMIVGRRSVGGWRFYLDDFLTDVMARLEFVTEVTWTRRLQSKSTPSKINRYGRSSDRRTSWRAEVSTINSEIITSFVRA